MKKIHIVLLNILLATSVCYAQTWSGSTPGNIYYNSGNVGIGTTGPGSLLQIGSATTRGTLSLIDGTGSLPGFTIANLASGGHSYTFYCGLSGAGDFDLYDQTSSAYRLTVAANGNVGIGITSPPAVGNYGVLAINGRAPSQGGYLSMQANGSEVGAVVANSQFAFQAASGVVTQFYTGGANTMTIDVNGKVGIGTINPAECLEVQNASSSANIKVSNTAGGFAKLGISDNSTSAATLAFTNSLSLTGGNVGIGTTSPDEKLTVNGTVHATEVKVTSSVPYPDYVFKPNYSLPKLNAIKRYIDKNHHLPNVPSEAEVARNGLNVGRSETMLLKKVEELTLYLIEKDKQLSRQQNQIDLLNKKLNKLAQRQPSTKK